MRSGSVPVPAPLSLATNVGATTSQSQPPSLSPDDDNLGHVTSDSDIPLKSAVSPRHDHYPPSTSDSRRRSRHSIPIDTHTHPTTSSSSSSNSHTRHEPHTPTTRTPKGAKNNNNKRKLSKGGGLSTPTRYLYDVMFSPRSSNYERLEGGMGPSRNNQSRRFWIGWKRFAIGAVVIVGLVWVFGPRKEDIIPEDYEKYIPNIPGTYILKNRMYKVC